MSTRVLQVRRRPYLGEEALRAKRCGEVGVQHLERDETVVLGIARQVHRCHATVPKLTLDDITAGEGGLELVLEGGGHRGTNLRW